MTVLFYGSVRDHTGGQKQIEILEAPKTLRLLIDRLAIDFGESFGEYLIGDETCFFLVGGKSVISIGGLDAPLNGDEKIEIIPVVSGG